MNAQCARSTCRHSKRQSATRTSAQSWTLYNLTNGEHMTQNGYLNIDVVKKEWGFDGIIMSDWSS